MSDVDVIVVGGGGSGLAAAITARRRGMSVLLLEKAPALGGSTGRSVGSYSAAGTTLQAARGIDDSPAEFLKDLEVSNGELEAHENVALRRLFVHEATRGFEFVQSLGVQFFGPTPEPPFENPRMHNVVPNSRAYISALTAEAVKAGVDIRTSAPVEGLEVDESRHVTGVKYRGRLSARSVILATGDFSASRELKARWVSNETAEVPPVNPFNTGDGLKMGLAAGAAVRNEWRLIEDLRFPPAKSTALLSRLPTGRRASTAMRLAIDHMPSRLFASVARRLLVSWVAPSRDVFRYGGVLVDGSGRRFADELGNTARALASSSDNRAWLICDADVAERFSGWPHPVSTFPGISYAYMQDYARIRRDVYRKASTIDGLAAAIGVPPGAFQVTVRRYNAGAANGVDPEFGRSELGNGLHRPPFVALGPLSAVVTITDGGLDVDESCRVLRDGVPIGGLYAVGSTGQAGLILKNHGLHIAWAIVSGRIAGDAVASDA